MSDSKLPGERRDERSEETKEAIRLQLKHVKEEYGFEFLAVGDSYGRLITGSGDPELEEILATFAPRILEADDATREELEETLREEIQPESEKAYFEVRKFTVRGMDMFICVVSPRRDGVDRALDHSIQGIKRISGDDASFG
jgi:hypothetical protein